MNDNERFISNWSRRRRHGPVRFILRSGAMLAILLLGVRILVDLIDQAPMEALAGNFAWQKLLSALVAGLVVGCVEWYAMERFYQKVKGAD